MALCPNCNASIAVDASTCNRCDADFSAAASWHPVPESPREHGYIRDLQGAREREAAALGTPEANVSLLSLAARTLLQLIIILMILLMLSGPITSADIGIRIAGLLFFAFLFVATLSIGEQKEKEWARVLGYPVNPRTLGAMLVVGGAFVLVASWGALSGQWPRGQSQGPQRWSWAIGLARQVPELWILIGLAAAFYGVQLFRAKQPSGREHRKRARRRTRAGDVEH